MTGKIDGLDLGFFIDHDKSLQSHEYCINNLKHGKSKQMR